MKDESRLPVALLTLRLSVFLVVLVWTLDKFVAADHATLVFRKFYFMDGLGAPVMYTIGAVGLVIVVGSVSS
jgi:hypothetical protein